SNWRSTPFFIFVFDTAIDACLRLDLCSICNGNMAYHAYSSTHYHLLAPPRPTRHPRLSRDDSVRTDFRIMRYLDQVVQFYPFSYYGRAQCCSINNGVGTNFYVVFKDDIPNLRNLLICPIRLRRKTKSITSYHRP